MKDNLQRVFVAINLISAVAQRLQSTIADLRPLDINRSVKWVEPENLHLTLLFLGEQRPEKVSSLAAELKMELMTIPCFPLELEGLGAFPIMHRPKVIYKGMKHSVALIALAAAVRQTSLRVGMVLEDKPFRAHLTLGRVRGDAQTGKIGEWLSAYVERNQAGDNADGPKQVVRSVTLFESMLKPTGPVYTPLHVFGLRD